MNCHSLNPESTTYKAGPRISCLHPNVNNPFGAELNTIVSITTEFLVGTSKTL